ncbi:MULTISPECIES: hypothetical protein [Aquimarina]|uniref:hypothetical protein n=1 Tax=Aquimarina TaxID=290174 RepID=UPI000945AA44|nr:MULTISPECIES: hypothetical protein [Aquimarina]
MQKSSTSLYRIRKTSWGIWVQISAGVKNSSQGDKISDNLYFEYKANTTHLTDVEIELLKEGLTWVSTIIEKKINTPTTITLNKIELNHCDYQVEGMFYGIAFWASEHFGFDLPEYQFKYDVKKNKYMFPDLDEKLKKLFTTLYMRSERFSFK